MDSEVPVAEQYRQFLLVRSGGACYALPAHEVRHVVRALTCYPVPGSRPHLLGLAQFAGEPLAVLDLHAMAEGLEPQSRHRTTVILGRGARDSRAAIGIAATDALRVQALPGGVPSKQPGGLVSAAVELGDELIRVVDTVTLVDERWPGEGSEHV